MWEDCFGTKFDKNEYFHLLYHAHKYQNDDAYKNEIDFNNIEQIKSEVLKNFDLKDAKQVTFIKNELEKEYL